MATALRRDGYGLVEVEDAVELSGYLGGVHGMAGESGVPDLLITDADLAGEPGFAILAHLDRKHLAVPAILLSDAVDEEMEREARHLGAAYAFTKPCEIEDVMVAAWSLVLPRQRRVHAVCVRGDSGVSNGGCRSSSAARRNVTSS